MSEEKILKVLEELKTEIVSLKEENAKFRNLINGDYLKIISELTNAVNSLEIKSLPIKENPIIHTNVSELKSVNATVTKKTTGGGAQKVSINNKFKDYYSKYEDVRKTFTTPEGEALITEKVSEAIKKLATEEERHFKKGFYMWKGILASDKDNKTTLKKDFEKYVLDKEAEESK